MKHRIRLVLTAITIMVGLFAVICYYNSTVTFLDRPFFLSGNKVTIVATKIDWMCNCANFVDTIHYKTNPVTEPADNDYFFIEAAQPGQDWDRNHFAKNKYVRLTGQFYIDKGLPREYAFRQLEDKPVHARIFKFDKIEYLTESD